MKRRIEMPPMFVHADVSFTLDGNAHKFPREYISLFGTQGLYSSEFSPEDMVGRELTVALATHGKKPLRLTTKSMITCQRTLDASYLGLKFLFDEGSRAMLDTLISSEGFYPTAYARKYPRIPARDSIPYMPIRAVLKSVYDDLVVFDIANMSPNGVLVFSENFKASLFPPGLPIQLQIEPRGHTFQPFNVEGEVRRVVVDRNPRSGHFTHYLGVQFTRMPDHSEEAFKEILKAVLETIRSESPA